MERGAGTRSCEVESSEFSRADRRVNISNTVRAVEAICASGVSFASMHWLMDLRALLILIGANTAPVLLARALGPRLAAPIDGNLDLRDGRRLFGSHKTWRGFVGGTLAAAAIAGMAGLPISLGVISGALALTGDLFSSFTKRRCGKPSGAWIPGLDQLPEALLPLTALKYALSMNWIDVAFTAAVFTAVGAVTSRLNDILSR